jgi:XTP/dITP diphosphohydrolase
MRHAMDPTPLVCQASWEGRILSAPQGDQGFGYDPLFYVPGYRCSAAQLAPGVKDRISHRARASALLLEAMRQG